MVENCTEFLEEAQRPVFLTAAKLLENCVARTLAAMRQRHRPLAHPAHHVPRPRAAGSGPRHALPRAGPERRASRRPRPCPPAPPGSEVTHAAPPRASTGSPPRGKRGSMARVLHTGGRVSEEPPAHRIGAASPGAARASPGTQRRSERACRVNPIPLRARSGQTSAGPTAAMGPPADKPANTLRAVGGRATR